MLQAKSGIAIKNPVIPRPNKRKTKIEITPAIKRPLPIFFSRVLVGIDAFCSGVFRIVSSFSSFFISSSRDTLKISASFTIFSKSGVELPFSHLDIDCLETLSSFAKSPWDRFR